MVIDHLDSDCACLRWSERPTAGPIKGRPCLLVDLGPEGLPQASVWVVRAREVGVTHEEALAVVVRVDEPAGECIRVVGADLSRRRVVDVDASDLNLDLVLRGSLDLEVGLAEDREEVARARLLEKLLAIDRSRFIRTGGGSLPNFAPLPSPPTRSQHLGELSRAFPGVASNAEPQTGAGRAPLLHSLLRGLAHLVGADGCLGSERDGRMTGGSVGVSERPASGDPLAGERLERLELRRCCTWFCTQAFKRFRAPSPRTTSVDVGGYPARGAWSAAASNWREALDGERTATRMAFGPGQAASNDSS